MKTIPFRLAINSQNLQSHQTVNSRQRLRQLLLQLFRSIFPQFRTFCSFDALEIANLFFESAISSFVSRSFKFPVLMAGNCYHSSFATESALFCVSDESLFRRNELSSFFKVTVQSKLVSMLSR